MKGYFVFAFVVVVGVVGMFAVLGTVMLVGQNPDLLKADLAKKTTELQNSQSQLQDTQNKLQETSKQLGDTISKLREAESREQLPGVQTYVEEIEGLKAHIKTLNDALKADGKIPPTKQGPYTFSMGVLVSPQNNGYIWDTVQLISVVSGIESSKVKSILMEYSADGLIWTSIGNGVLSDNSFKVSWDTTNVQEGEYFVKSTGIDENDVQVFALTTIKIAKKPEAKYAVGREGSSLKFSAAASTGAIVEYLWTFSDGFVSKEKSFTRSYSAQNWDVSLIVKTIANLTSEAKFSVQDGFAKPVLPS